MKIIELWLFYFFITNTNIVNIVSNSIRCFWIEQDNLAIFDLKPLENSYKEKK